jgi:hypothetical protein
MVDNNQYMGLFDCLESLYDAMAEGNIRRVLNENLPDNLKRFDSLNLVQAKGLPIDRPDKMQLLAQVFFGGLHIQLDKEKGEKVDGVNCDYGTANMGGKRYFYYVWPQNKALELKQIRNYLDYLKELFSDTQPEGLLNKDKVHVGPFSELDRKIFKEVFDKLVTFNEKARIKTGIAESSSGLKYSFDRAVYLSLFEKDLGFSPVEKKKAPDLSLVPQSNTLH